MRGALVPGRWGKEEEEEVLALGYRQLAIFQMSMSWSGGVEPGEEGPEEAGPGWRRRPCPGGALGIGDHGWNVADGAGGEILSVRGRSSKIRWKRT